MRETVARLKKTPVDLLSSDEVRGRIIRDTAFLDLFLGIIIGQYFTSDDRFALMYDSIIERMTFNQKIEVLRGIVRDRRYKSAEVVQRLQRIKKLRNAVAHSHFFHEYDKLFRDKDVVALLSNYPASFKREMEAAKRQLRRLADTKEFLQLHSHNLPVEEDAP